MTAPIETAAQVTAQIKERLLAEFPDLAEDEAALFDTLDGLTEFNEIAVALIQSAEDDAAFADALGVRMADMQIRRDRFKKRHDAKRAAVAQAMETVGVKKIEAPECTLSLRAVPPKVVVIDEAQIPDAYWREKTVRSVDRDALKNALKTETIPGAQMSNGGVGLTVRTK